MKTIRANQLRGGDIFRVDDGSILIRKSHQPGAPKVNVSRLPVYGIDIGNGTEHTFHPYDQVIIREYEVKLI